MTEPGAQYDHIGSKYDEYARTATLKRAESYTFFCMVGALAGKRVMDLACGFGFYTRLLKQHGAAQVIGVDISPEMVRLATQQEQAEPLGITYQVCDAVALPRLGPFDLVTAVYLLDYATSKDQLLLRPPSGGTGGARPCMSGQFRRPDSETSPGIPRRWHRKTSRAMGKRIGAISTTIA